MPAAGTATIRFGVDPNLPDGRYRTLRWQSNVSGRTGSLLRKYNREGALVWARWDRPDGSEVVFDVRNADGILIYPTTAEMKEYTVHSGHPEWLRAEIRASEAGTSKAEPTA